MAEFFRRLVHTLYEEFGCFVTALAWEFRHQTATVTAIFLVAFTAAIVIYAQGAGLL